MESGERRYKGWDFSKGRRVMRTARVLRGERHVEFGD